MKPRTPEQAAVAALPRARIAVVGMRTHGTSEVIAALRSLDREAGLEESIPRRIEAPSRQDGSISLINDFGPQLGSPRMHSLVTHKRSFALYECVDGVQSLLLSGSRRFDAVLWVQSATADVELDPIASMLDGAQMFGARRAMVFVTDVEQVSDARRDATEQEARQMLELAGFAADESAVISASAPIRRDVGDRWKPAVRALRDALDEQAPYVESESFSMRVDDVFFLKGRGVVATGQVNEGTVRVGDSLDLLSINGRRTITVKGIELIRRVVERARRGDNIGLFLSLSSRDEIARDDLLVTPTTGRVARVVRARAFNWAGARTPTRCRPLASMYGQGTDPIRVRWISVDPMPDQAMSYELEFELAQPLATTDATTFVLGDERGSIGVAFIDEVIE